MEMAKKSLLVLMAVFFMTAALCEEAPVEEVPEEESTAAERLQQPRNMYEGNVNENLRELQDDLNEASEDRVRDIDEKLE